MMNVWGLAVRGMIAFLLLGMSALSASGEAAQPNVLFLICDDLNCDLGCYGHPLVQTPNLDGLAARGVRFANAHCQFPLCGPSRASFMTGMYPAQTLVRRNAVYVREHTPNVVTLPQMFRRAGYQAARIGKIYHYNVPKHIGTGGHDDPYSWNFTINPRGRDVDDEPLIFSLRPNSFGGTLSWLAAEGTDAEQTDGIAATETIRLLQQYAQTNQSFFLAVGLYRPHTPYVAPKKYFDMYPLESIRVPQVPAGYLATLPKPAQTSVRRKKEQLDLADDLARRAIQAYYASITFADAQLGRILEALEQTGLSENTIVLFTSDHGYHMGEHAHWQKTTLFGNATHVPLIMAGPGVPASGKAAQTPAEMVDFYPTLAELCGLEPPRQVAGKSLVPALKDPAVAVRDGALTQYANGYSLRTAGYRYTEWGDAGTLGAELYDCRRDAAELSNLAGSEEHAEIQQRLATQLRRRVQEANQPPAGVKQLRFDDVRRVPR